MSSSLLKVAECLAYGPFVLMLGLYVVAVGLRGCGRPNLLSFLIKSTNEHLPVPRPPH